MTKKDPIVEEIRKFRDRLAARLNYNIKEIIDDAKKRQDSSGLKIVRLKRQAA